MKGQRRIMKRVPELDALRGLAVLAVALFHLNLKSTNLFQWGWTGVDVFFLLSGYLITTILLKNGGTPGFLFNFYARRCLRIWPIYYLTLILMCLAYRIFMQGIRLDGLWVYLLYFQYGSLYWNGTEPPLDLPLSHTWSLAVEEQFYLVWPFLLAIFGKRGLIPIALITIAIAVLMRQYGYPTWLLLTRCDSLALGSLLSLVFLDAEWSQRKVIQIRCAFAGLLILTCFVPVGYWLLTGEQYTMEVINRTGFGLLLIEIAYASFLGLILTMLGRPILAPLRMRWLVGLGTISYGFYLYHWIIFVLSLGIGRRLGILGLWWFDLARLVISIFVATLSWFLVEKPILSLKSRFEYARSSKPDLESVSG